MHFHCAGSAEWLIGCELTDQPGADDADESALGDESQTTTAAHHGAFLAFRKATPEGPVAVVSLANSTNYAWAAGRSGPTAGGTSSCARRRARGWACRGPMVQALTYGVPTYQIALYGNSIADWAAGAMRLWLVRRGAAALPGGVSLTRELAGTPLDLAIHQTPTSAASGQQQQQDQTAPPGQREQQQQQQSHRPGRTPQVQVPYSVPALAVGDVFLSCNTVAGLEHADDWDLGSWLVGGGTASSSSASQAPPGSRQSPLDPASELLLRMSAPVGGQRLMFVSKESAELVRRALLLSRYDEIMERRAEAKEEAEALEGAAAAAGAGAAPSTRLVVSTSAATGARVPRVAEAAGGTGGAAGWGAAWRGAEGTASGGGGGHSDGADEDRPRPPFAPWPRKPTTDRAPARGTSPVVPPANPKAVTEPKSTQDANPNLVNGSGSVALSGGSATGAHDSLHLVMPGWVPGPVREAATAVARGVSGWWAHAGGGAAAAASGVPQGVAALFKLGAAGGGVGGVLDVSPGPRARLPAPPLTHAMQLPPLAPVAAGEEERRQQSLKGEAAARHSGPAEAAAGPSSTGTRAAADRTRWDGEALMRELKQLEEEKVIADAEALLQAGRRGAAGGGGGDGDSGGGGFLPPFSFSSYVARLPLEAALKAILSTPTAAAAAAAASSAAAADPAVAAEVSEAAGVAHAAADDAAVMPALAAIPVRRRFCLCPDLADEQAVEGSREVDRLVAELEAAAAAAAAAGAEDVARAEIRAEAEKPADAGPGGGAKGADGAAAVRAASGGSASSSGGAANGRRAGPRPRVALNLYDSDASHWVLDVVDKLEHDSSEAGSDSNSTTTTTGGASGGGGSSSGSQPAALPTERFIRGTPGGPSEDLGGLVQLPTPREPSAAVTGRPKAAGLNASAAEPGPALGDGNFNSGGGRTPVFLLPGVTISVRAADGTLLRLRPAFLALPQLAAVLALLRDAVATSWRRQRSAARWKVVSALDVLTVHSAGFPIMRVPPVSTSAGGAAGAAGASGGGGAGNGADEDSDEALPEAKELLREMGAGNRRPSAADTAAAAASPSTPLSGPLAVLSTLAVGVVSFSSWCIASAVDVWEDVYFRTPWGLEEMGLPQHINVTPTYLEDHVRHLAEANAPAVAAAATAARVRAVQRVLERRARRRQTQAREQQQLLQQLQQEPPQDPATSTDGERQQGAVAAGPALEQTAGSTAATAVNDGGAAAVAPTGAQAFESAAPTGAQAFESAAPTGGKAPQSTAGPAAGGAAPEAATPASIPTESKAVTNPAEAVVAAMGDAAAGTGHSQGGKRHRTATPAAATVTPHYSGLSLQTESMAGLSLLLQFVWAGMRAAQVQVQKDGVFSSDLGDGGSSVDGLLRLAGAGGRGLTMTATQSGELDVVAKLDVRPVASAPAVVSPAAAATASKAAASAASAGAAAKPEPANANGEAAAGRPAAAAAAGAGGESTSAPPPPQQQQQQQRSGPAAAAPVTPTAAAPPTPASAPPAASKTGGLLIRELGPTSESGIRYELMHSSAKLASQVTRPHKFEVGLHVSLRKLLGDMPEDAPDTLLKLQQPAGPTPSGVGASAAGAARRGASGQPLEAQGLILIGDLGLDEVDEGTLMLPPSMGFADLGGLLLPPPPPSPLPAGQWGGSAAAAAAAALAMGDYGEGGSLEGEDSGGSEAAAGGMGGGGGTSRAGSGGGSRGWAAGGPGRGAWGRWGR